LFDRRFYHIIIAEDQNYKVEIYNYSKKQDVYSPKRETGKSNIGFDQELKGFEYRYFTFDYFYSFFYSKRYINNFNEKNEVFWSNYDVQFNDLKQNMKKLKFKNELSFLLIDYPNNLNNSKKSQAAKNIGISGIKKHKNNNNKEEKYISLIPLNKKDSEKTNNEIGELDELILNSNSKNSKYFLQDTDDNDLENDNLNRNFGFKKEDFILESATLLSKTTENNFNLNNAFENEKNNLMQIIENSDDIEFHSPEALRSPSSKMKKYNLIHLNCKNKNSSNVLNNDNLENKSSNKTRFDSYIIASNISTRDNLPFYARVKNCIKQVENYLTKYKGFNERFSSEIKYISDVDIEDKEILGN